MPGYWRSRAPANTAPNDLFALRSPTGVALVAATVLASMVGFIDAYMINVAVPAIAEDLNASVSQLQSVDGASSSSASPSCWWLRCAARSHRRSRR